MSTAAALEASEPIIIYRSVNRDGQTFALHPRSRDRLREHFGDAIDVHKRVFIAHESLDDYQRLLERLSSQIVVLLAGVSIERLEELGGVSFREPVTENEISLDRATGAGTVADLG